MGASSSGVSGENDTPVTAKATPTAEVESIVSTLVSEKPSVQEHAIAQAQADAAAAVGKDKSGNVFNPAIHAVNADGSPRVKADGSYALKRGKKPNASQSAQKPQSVKGIAVPGTVVAPDAKAQESRAAGVGAANLMFALMRGMGGEEWAPRFDEKIGINEKLMMEQAHADAFEAWGWGDLPPGLALAAAYCMYALPRLQMPATKTRMQKFKGWLGGKIGQWRMERKARQRGFPITEAEKMDKRDRDARAGDSDRA